MLPPERSNIVLSCLADPGDLSGLVDRVQISGPCVLFLTDNPRMELGAPGSARAPVLPIFLVPELQAGLGELEIKPETRFAPARRVI
jgi:hypothetical protein